MKEGFVLSIGIFLKFSKGAEISLINTQKAELGGEVCRAKKEGPIRFRSKYKVIYHVSGSLTNLQ